MVSICSRVPEDLRLQGRIEIKLLELILKTIRYIEFSRRSVHLKSNAYITK